MKVSPERIKRGMYWDRALSLVEGCSKISPGCDNCWSEKQAAMRVRNPLVKHRYEPVITDGEWNGGINLMWDDISKPLHVKKPTVWAVWNDLFHHNTAFSFVYKVFTMMAQCPQHKFIILTKRALRMASVLWGIEFHIKKNYPDVAWPLQNVILGVTAESQMAAESRIPMLLSVPANTHFVSVEPMLGPVNLPKIVNGISWVVCGGETGPCARPMHPDWARSLRDQCVDAKVPFFFKHWGEWEPIGPRYSGDRTDAEEDRWADDRGKRVSINILGDIAKCEFPQPKSFLVERVGKKKAGRMLDGVEWSQLPNIE